MRLFANTLILLTSLCLSGCIPIPYKYTGRQEVSGHLEDYDSGQPVSGATITLSRDNFEDKKPVSILNEPNGDFIVPSLRSWGVLPIGLPIDFKSPHWTLTITAPQYQPHSEEFRTDVLRSKPLQLGTVTLKKEQSSADPPPKSKAYQTTSPSFTQIDVRVVRISPEIPIVTLDYDGRPPYIEAEFRVLAPEQFKNQTFKLRIVPSRYGRLFETHEFRLRLPEPIITKQTPPIGTPLNTWFWLFGRFIFDTITLEAFPETNPQLPQEPRDGSSYKNAVLIEYDPAKTAASKEIDWMDKNIGAYQLGSSELQGLDEEEPVIRFEAHTELINGRLFSVRYYTTAPDTPDSSLLTVYFDITAYSEHQVSDSPKK